jgi:hypothetical protein
MTDLSIRRPDGRTEEVPSFRAVRLIDAGAAEPLESWTAEDLAAFDAARATRAARDAEVLGRDGLLVGSGERPQGRQLGPMERLSEGGGRW